MVYGVLHGTDADPTLRLSYTYDDFGRLTSRVLNTTVNRTAGYTYLGGGVPNRTTSIPYMVTNDGLPMWYATYDADGNLSGIMEGAAPTTYTYDALHQLVRENCYARGETIAYTYDAWGAPRTITDGSNNDVSSDATHIANINPIRYRGYYYDTDTGFYYLQSRYYDPIVGRFLNADGCIGANGDIIGYNMFAYCSNNPIIYNDYSGRGLLSELWNFAKDLICEVGEAIEVLSPAYAGCEYLALADGPLPIGDLIGLAAQAGGVLSGLRRLSAGQDQRPRHKKMSRGAAHAKKCYTGGAHSAPPVCCGMEFRGSPSFAALPAEPTNPPWNRSRSAAGRPCRCRARAPCGRAARAGPAPLPDNSCRG